MSANPFWEFSLELYERPGVAAAAISLQDELGLDVNLLFFCIWCGLAGPGRLLPEVLHAAVAATAEWQSAVVRPLRASRRAAKSAGGTGLFASAFRRDVAATELSAERVEQWLLFDLVGEHERAERDPRQALAAAGGNIVDYLRDAGVELAPARAHLESLLGACWPEIGREALREALAARA